MEYLNCSLGTEKIGFGYNRENERERTEFEVDWNEYPDSRNGCQFTWNISTRTPAIRNWWTSMDDRWNHVERNLIDCDKSSIEFSDLYWINNSINIERVADEN